MLKRVKLIQTKIYSKFVNRPVLQKIVKNMGWLSFDRIFQLVIALTVGIWLTRYLGPNDFGVLSYALALNALLIPIIGFGTGSLIVRELVTHENKKNIVLGSCAFINIITCVFAFILLNIVAYFLNLNDFFIFLVVFLSSLNFLIIGPYNVFAAWFNSKIESKINVITYNIAIIISSVLKVIFIILGLPLVYFMIITLIESLISLIFIVYFYKKSGENFRNWQVDFNYIQNLLKSSWPLVLSGAMVILYMRIDQVMIGMLLNTTQVGIYSVSVKLSELFFFLPGVIIASIFPNLVKSKLISKEIYALRLNKLFYLFTWIPFLIIIPLFLFANQIVYFLYGAEYLGAALALAISIWALFPIFIKSATESYLINENLVKIIFVNSVVGAGVNIFLNYLLIPVYGIYGAAIATLIAYIFATYFGLILFKQTRPIFWMLVGSFNIFKGIKYFLNKDN